MSAPLRYTTARKTYRCARCGRVIPRGELHAVASRQHKRYHRACAKGKLNYGDDHPAVYDVVADEENAT